MTSLFHSIEGHGGENLITGVLAHLLHDEHLLREFGRLIEVEWQHLKDAHITTWDWSHDGSPDLRIRTADYSIIVENKPWDHSRFTAGQPQTYAKALARCGSEVTRRVLVILGTEKNIEGLRSETELRLTRMQCRGLRRRFVTWECLYQRLKPRASAYARVLLTDLERFRMDPKRSYQELLLEMPIEHLKPPCKPIDFMHFAAVVTRLHQQVLGILPARFEVDNAPAWGHDGGWPYFGAYVRVPKRHLLWFGFWSFAWLRANPQVPFWVHLYDTWSDPQETIMRKYAGEHFREIDYDNVIIPMRDGKKWEAQNAKLIVNIARDVLRRT